LGECYGLGLELALDFTVSCSSSVSAGIDVAYVHVGGINSSCPLVT